MEQGSRIGHTVSLGGGIADLRFHGPLPGVADRPLTLSDPPVSIDVARLPAAGPARGPVRTRRAAASRALAVPRHRRLPYHGPAGEWHCWGHVHGFSAHQSTGRSADRLPVRPMLRAAGPARESPRQGPDSKTVHLKMRSILLFSSAGASAPRPSPAACAYEHWPNCEDLETSCATCRGSRCGPITGSQHIAPAGRGRLERFLTRPYFSALAPTGNPRCSCRPFDTHPGPGPRGQSSADELPGANDSDFHHDGGPQ